MNLIQKIGMTIGITIATTGLSYGICQAVIGYWENQYREEQEEKRQIKIDKEEKDRRFYQMHPDLRPKVYTYTDGWGNDPYDSEQLQKWFDCHEKTKFGAWALKEDIEECRSKYSD